MASPLLSPLLRITRRSQLKNIEMMNTRHAKRSRKSIDEDDELHPATKKRRVKSEIHRPGATAPSQSSKSIAAITKTGTARSRQPSVKTLNGANIESKTTKRAHFDGLTNGDLETPKEIVDSAKEKRTLRSRDGVFRTKSDLSLYFPGYEETLSNEPKTPGIYTQKVFVYY